MKAFLAILTAGAICTVLPHGIAPGQGVDRVGPQTEVATYNGGQYTIKVVDARSGDGSATIEVSSVDGTRKWEWSGVSLAGLSVDVKGQLQLKIGSAPDVPDPPGDDDDDGDDDDGGGDNGGGGDFPGASPLSAVKDNFGMADKWIFLEQKKAMLKSLDDIPDNESDVNGLNGWVQRGFAIAQMAYGDHADKWDPFMKWYQVGASLQKTGDEFRTWCRNELREELSR